MAKIKVLVVDDSAFMRKMISDIINSSPELEVIAKARNGKDAISKTKDLQPDVITMDIEMPEMDGLTALKNIMKETPVPVIMLSSLTSQGAEQTLRALQLGAVDFITKPSGQISLDIEQVSDDIIKKVKAVAGTKRNVINLYSSTEIPIPRKSIPVKTINSDEVLNQLVLIGTSTGGPKALHQVIPRLPARIDAAFLVVQHMPPGFTRSLAERLDSLSEVRVKEAEDGEKVLPGYVYIAPGDYHMMLNVQGTNKAKQLYIHLDKSAPRGGTSSGRRCTAGVCSREVLVPNALCNYDRNGI
jgi:two-component system chemotaxis response regulator CheB